MPRHSRYQKPAAPKVPEQILNLFLKANQAFPQMYGVMITRAGRAAVDMMLAGQLTVDKFARTAPSNLQKDRLFNGAVVAHERAGISVPYSRQDGDFSHIENRIVTPSAVRGVYSRTQRGILNAIQNHGWFTVELPDEEIPEAAEAERKFVCRYLIERPENRPSAELLQTIWQTADDSLNGRAVAEATANLHTALSDLPPYENRIACAVAITRATRTARTALNAVLDPALDSLQPYAEEVLGSRVLAADVLSSFKMYSMHEGCDEYTDRDIQNLSLRDLRRGSL
jgi:hypothetical protein